MLNYQDTVSYLGAVSFISAYSGPYGICHALHNDNRLTKEAARIICDTIYWTSHMQRSVQSLVGLKLQDCALCRV